MHEYWSRSARCLIIPLLSQPVCEQNNLVLYCIGCICPVRLLIDFASAASLLVCFMGMLSPQGQGGLEAKIVSLVLMQCCPQVVLMGVWLITATDHNGPPGTAKETEWAAGTARETDWSGRDCQCHEMRGKWNKLTKITLKLGHNWLYLMS